MTFAENGVCGKKSCPNDAGQTELARSKHSPLRPRHFHGAANKTNLHSMPLLLRADCRFSPRQCRDCNRVRTPKDGCARGCAPQKLRLCFSRGKLTYITLKSPTASRGRQYLISYFRNEGSRRVPLRRAAAEGAYLRRRSALARSRSM